MTAEFSGHAAVSNKQVDSPSRTNITGRLTAQEGLRAQTLVNLRWIAIVGQFTAIVVVAFGMEFSLPLVPVLALVLTSVLLNIATTLRFPSSARLGPEASLALLAYDLLQLGGLLYLTGGIKNPFSMLLIVPVVISAGSLPLRYTLALGGLAVGTSGFLAGFHLPLPWHASEPFVLPPLYLAASWFAVLATLLFAAVYAWRVAEEARSLSYALSATELALTREQHLSQLDGIAAAAAHELGTPLATITLVVKEMQKDLADQADYTEDLTLLAEQTQRCRDILSKIGSLTEGEGNPFAHHSLTELLRETSAPHTEFGIAIEVSAEGAGEEPVWSRNPGLEHGLGNIIENAVDFARDSVEVRARWSDEVVEIRVTDDGPGFPPDRLTKIGEPDPAAQRAATKRQRGDDAKGLGLGLFIAKTLLERTGAQMTFSNRPGSQTGAIVKITWTRAEAERWLAVDMNTV
ncbi:MAG: ActS/PrrB/RegB family redox-sensitive histidine kinase [Pseudomonadota bacterium]